MLRLKNQYAEKQGFCFMDEGDKNNSLCKKLMIACFSNFGIRFYRKVIISTHQSLLQIYCGRSELDCVQRGLGCNWNARISVVFSLLLVFFAVAPKYYDLNCADPIDIVMPCHPKDLEILDLCIDGALKNIKGIRRVIVVSETKLTDKAEWFPEDLYPFNKYSLVLEVFGDEVRASRYMSDPKNRAGWILKQFLVLYHTRVIPGLSSNVLFIDCDTIFMKPVTFFDEDGCALYNPGLEFNINYFNHASRVIPGFKKVFRNYSGISHHMLFQKSILEDMLNVIELNGKDEAWKVLCRAIDKECMYRSPLSEYELYFNFAFANTNQVRLRTLNWMNSPDFYKLNYFNKLKSYDYISFHHYARKKSPSSKKKRPTNIPKQKYRLKFNNKNNKKRAK